jgi:hypothetical protein
MKNEISQLILLALNLMRPATSLTVNNCTGEVKKPVAYVTTRPSTDYPTTDNYSVNSVDNSGKVSTIGSSDLYVECSHSSPVQWNVEIKDPVRKKTLFHKLLLLAKYEGSYVKFG